MLLLLLCSFSLVCFVVPSEEEGASFYRWRGGGLWKMLIPSWKVPNQPLGTLNLGITLWTVLGEVVWTDLERLGSRQATRGAPAPWVRPHPGWATLNPISLGCFLWSPRLGPWQCCAELSWFGWILGLFSTCSGLWFGWLWVSFPFGSCQVLVLLYFLYTLGIFLV